MYASCRVQFQRRLSVKDARLLDTYPNLVPYTVDMGPPQYVKFDGTSNYNSLQASLQRRFSKGLTFGLAYTWSESPCYCFAAIGDIVDAFHSRLVDYRAADLDRTSHISR